jgi:hypothetical protein
MTEQNKSIKPVKPSVVPGTPTRRSLSPPVKPVPPSPKPGTSYRFTKKSK